MPTMDAWPAIEPARDGPTFAHIHLVTQMLGKLRVAHSPWVNHGWHTTLHVTPHGLTQQPICIGASNFALSLDLVDHRLRLATNAAEDSLPLAPGTIADTHRALVAMLDRYGLPSGFDGRPSEVDAPVWFADDQAPRAYDPSSAVRMHGALVSADCVFRRFRAGFTGKASPSHLFWGALDLAVTRFSGRRAPEHPGGVPGLPDRITREAYSHEVSSAGFWLGGVTQVAPLFYSYAYPEPSRFRQAAVEPAAARFDQTLGEFVLGYETVRGSDDPEAMLMRFLETTYAAAADLADWDRGALERAPVAP